MGVAVGVAVGGVELGGDVGVVARDRRVGVVAGEGGVDLVVRRRSVDLPAGAVEQQLGGGVVVDEELEPDLVDEVDRGARLGLGGRLGAAVGLAEGLRRAALVVVAPLEREVAVHVDAVTGGDLAVTVVVAQRLAPHPVALGEGEVVPVGVLHRQEPQLGRVEDLRDATVLAVLLEDVVHEALHHLRRDPLPRVLGAAVEDGGLAAVLGLRGVLADLDGEDVLALARLACLHELGELGVRAGGGDHVVADAAVLAVGLEDVVPARRLAGHQRARLDPVDLLELQRHTLGAELGGLLRRQHDLDLGLAVLGRAEHVVPSVDTGLTQELQIVSIDCGRVDLEAPRWCSAGWRLGRGRGGRHGCEQPSDKRGGEHDRYRTSHAVPPRGQVVSLKTRTDENLAVSPRGVNGCRRQPA